MHTHKVKSLIVAVMVMAAGCVNPSKVAPSAEEIDDLKRELAASKQEKETLRSQYIEQNEEMSRILNDLAAISGKTSSLRLDVESGSARMTQADQISGSIKDIKARIAALEKSNSVMAGKNTQFKEMIDGFNRVIEGQEREIASLKEDIQNKEITIRSQKDTIDSQVETISLQRDELEQRVAQQAKSLCEAGILLEEIADDAPQVSWKKNKEKVGAMTQDIYCKALQYYRQSYEAGYAPAKDHIAKVNAKIVAR